MAQPGKIIVQFRKNGNRVTTKTVGTDSGFMSDFEAVAQAEGILQDLADRCLIPSSLLDYDTVRINNVRDIAVSETGRNKGALSILSINRAKLADTLAYLKR